MKTKLRWVVIILVIVLMLVEGVKLTQADQIEKSNPWTAPLGNPALYPWKKMYVQRQPNPLRDVGRYIAMTLRPFDDYPILAYYDATNGDLMLAIPVGAGIGNCGTDNSWLCNPIDGTGTYVGSEVSIDSWGKSIDLWKLGIKLS